MTENQTEGSLSKRLLNVQMKLNAPKSNRNSFGNYDYRSAEDILEAVKPLLQEEGLLLIINDELVNIGDRYYVKARAQVVSADSNEVVAISAEAYAREAEDKKGMDSAQVTGATSSYARKYALNGLFAIDDAKDADTDEHHKQVDNTPTYQPSNTVVLARAKKKINETLEAQGYNTAAAKMAFIELVLEHSTISDLNEADSVMDALENQEAA